MQRGCRRRHQHHAAGRLVLEEGQRALELCGLVRPLTSWPSRIECRELQHVAAGAGGEHAVEVGEAGLERRRVGAAVQAGGPAAAPRTDRRRRWGCRRARGVSRSMRSRLVTSSVVTVCVGLGGRGDDHGGAGPGAAAACAVASMSGRRDAASATAARTGWAWRPRPAGSARVADGLGGLLRHVQAPGVAEDRVDAAPGRADWRP